MIKHFLNFVWWLIKLTIVLIIVVAAKDSFGEITWWMAAIIAILFF